MYVIIKQNAVVGDYVIRPTTAREARQHGVQHARELEAHPISDRVGPIARAELRRGYAVERYVSKREYAQWRERIDPAA